MISNSSLRKGVLAAIGNTPLIHIPSISNNCQIYGKCEWMNVGGSIKDRAALFLVQQAELAGKIKPGGTIVEGTAGNTGIGLAHVCRSKGYNLVIFMPNTQSAEKITTLESLGAKVFPVPVKPFTDPQNFNQLAKTFAESNPNHYWTNQFDNTDNLMAHIQTTGPEILSQLPDIDAFVCSTGTGGTLSGIAQYLKQNNPRTKVFVADPPGSVIFNYVTSGKLERFGESSITEGIGQGRITENFKQALDLLDGAVHCSDQEFEGVNVRSVNMMFHLLDKEGIYIGASSALNVVAATKVADLVGPGKKIVTMLCDGMGRYASRLNSRNWLESKGLYEGIPDHLKKYVVGV